MPLCGKTSNSPFIVINSYETEIIFEGALKKGEKEERKINKNKWIPRSNENQKQLAQRKNSAGGHYE